MDGTSIVAWLSLIGLFVTGAFTLFGKKLRAPEDDLAARRDTIADRDSWIKQLNERLDKMDTRLQNAEAEIESMRDHNSALIAYCHKLISIIRRHGHEAEIPNPPPNGIHF